MRLLAGPRSEDPDERDGLDHPEDPLPADQRRGGQGVRQAQVRGKGRGSAGRPVI